MSGTWDESKHPRVPAGSGDASGEFAGGQVSGTRESLHDMFKRISKPDGGFTYQPRLHFEPKTGYPVSIYPKRSFAKAANELTMMDIAKYMTRNVDLLTKRDHYLGAWHKPKSNQVFLDVSIVVGTAKEARDLALRHDQISYFDLRNGRSVEVNPHAKSGGVAD